MWRHIGDALFTMHMSTFHLETHKCLKLIPLQVFAEHPKQHALSTHWQSHSYRCLLCLLNTHSNMLQGQCKINTNSDNKSANLYEKNNQIVSLSKEQPDFAVCINPCSRANTDDLFCTKKKALIFKTYKRVKKHTFLLSSGISSPGQPSSNRGCNVLRERKTTFSNRQGFVIAQLFQNHLKIISKHATQAELETTNEKG